MLVMLASAFTICGMPFPLPSDYLIRGVIRRTFATRPDGLRVYESPSGDVGLFGPDSVTWRIHADFPGMMSGGLCALLLQTLHPLALAGVWDHSNFRHDLLGRLRRTTAFVAATTYAPTAHARAEIERVRAIHERVAGTLPDGRRYSASDPALLTWVHVTEMWSFLAGFQTYRGMGLPLAVRDRYFDETARVADALGARGVPRSVAEVEAYFDAIQDDLEFSARSATVIEVLEHIRLPGMGLGPARALFLGSGAALLPAWARARMQRGRLRRVTDVAARTQLRWLAPLIRRSLREGVAARSCRRVGRDLSLFESWPQDREPSADLQASGTGPKD